MFRVMIDKVWWWLTHEHELYCDGHDERIKPAKERWYWHIVKCRWCDTTWSVLNQDCRRLSLDNKL